jgi:fused signal recognition particle receptor
MTLAERLKAGLAKTRAGLSEGIERVARAFGVADEGLYEELEELLILADLGAGTAADAVEALRARVKAERIADAGLIKQTLADILRERLSRDAEPFVLDYPAVILVVGVNGTGKTTTVGKLAHLYKSEGRTVLAAAADTFRAAATEQLEIWCERAGVPLVKQGGGADPAAVVYDAVGAARARGVDLLIVDTAGRLHNKKNLMDELNKIFRVVSTQYPEARREVFVVLDATTGQNALQQARLFGAAAGVTGLVLTKLDGTAKGGVVVSLTAELDIPVRFVGVGEGLEDLQPFDAEAFARALIE